MSILQNITTPDYILPDSDLAKIISGADLSKLDSSAASGISIAVSVFSVIGTIVIALSVFPQTIKTMKDRNTASLSFLLFFLTGLATTFLALYGIGLITVKTNSSAFLVGVTSDTGKGIFNYQEYVAGFLVPGIFLLACEGFMAVTSFMVAFVKLANQIKAKKAGMSELDYYEVHIKPTLNLKGAK
ncbi:PQ-loop domain-containing transporter [Ureaplasma miroungigenitalium]|uniref:PQ-loop domain-containing transporter n=1 Tax=Ureaplasma miroungigenitalium TaxID=1042321 RepID=A0ABT3BND1_9BACT|nr:PQ-loop domain-containing transporter [Ureaplasma miroungigenitalium]MCV3728731.1 PQ-loop domain-containing transporter [Ureaplasma miroungigenitalium]MCV3734495.1 PQ-loop domain-containing transporter [Ureaplasma miroungigenitalium]